MHRTVCLFFTFVFLQLFWLFLLPPHAWRRSRLACGAESRSTGIYPFRKRILGIKGRKNPISRHIYCGLIGAILVNPMIRFHEAQKFCIECHTEHQELKKDISKIG